MSNSKADWNGETKLGIHGLFPFLFLIFRWFFSVNGLISGRPFNEWNIQKYYWKIANSTWKMKSPYMSPSFGQCPRVLE